MSRLLDPASFCEACEARFRERGQIGVCEHPFPGRPFRWWWANIEPPAAGETKLRRLGIARARTIDEARELLQPPERHPVSELSDAELIAACAGLAEPGSVVLEDQDVPKGWWRRWSPYLW